MWLVWLVCCCFLFIIWNAVPKAYRIPVIFDPALAKLPQRSSLCVVSKELQAIAVESFQTSNIVIKLLKYQHRNCVHFGLNGWHSSGATQKLYISLIYILGELLKRIYRISSAVTRCTKRERAITANDSEKRRPALLCFCAECRRSLYCS